MLEKYREVRMIINEKLHNALLHYENGGSVTVHLCNIITIVINVSGELRANGSYVGSAAIALDAMQNTRTTQNIMTECSDDIVRIVFIYH